MFRCHAFNKEIARLEHELDGARDTLLRRRQKCLDVLAHKVELFAFVNEVAVDRRETVLDAYLLCAEHQFFEFAMRRDQGDRGGCFKCDPSLRAEHGIAQVYAPADAIAAGERFEIFDQCGQETLTSENSIPEDAWVLSADAFNAPKPASQHTIEFAAGVPVALDGASLSPVALIENVFLRAVAEGNLCS